MSENKNMQDKNSSSLMKFIEATKDLDWSVSSKATFQKLFDSILNLIYSEIQYYDQARKRMKRLSNIFRILGLILGTLGFLAPLVEIAGWCDDVSKLGYVFLMGAAAVFTANSLFGGTKGFTRYVEAKLRLERWVVVSVIQWSDLVHSNTNDEEKFSFLKQAMEEAYTIILTETSAWSDALNEAVKKYELKLSESSK